jgi:uncharacterized Zn finger protein (UPF0148 family)
MSQIRCPHCGEVFTVDESGYAELVKQARDAEFAQEVAERERLLMSAHAAEVKAAEARVRGEGEKALAASAGEVAQLKERLAALDGKNGVREETASIQAQQQTLLKRQTRLEALTLQSLDAEAAYSDLYRRFIAGQAGLLAGDLRHRLIEDGEASCPVCRSSLNRAHIPQLAMTGGETPEQAEVDSAKAARDRAEKQRSEEQTQLAALVTHIDARKTALLERAFSLLPDCAGWEKLCAAGYAPQVKALIASYGAASLSGVPAEALGDLMDAARLLGGEENAG